MKHHPGLGRPKSFGMTLKEVEAKIMARNSKPPKPAPIYPCKAYLIDTPSKTIKEVEYDNKIETIYQHLGFECIEFREIMLNGRFDCLYVDAEALDKAQTNLDLRQYLFCHKRYHSMLIGRGLVIGHDSEGDAQSPHISLETLKQEIRWE